MSKQIYKLNHLIFLYFAADFLYFAGGDHFSSIIYYHQKLIRCYSPLFPVNTFLYSIPLMLIDRVTNHNRYLPSGSI